MTIIYKESFLISGIMCHASCQITISKCIVDYLDKLKKENTLPNDVKINIDSEPASLGLMRLIVLIESDDNHLKLPNNLSDLLGHELMEIGFPVTKRDDSHNQFNYINWVNILINLIAIISIIVLTIIFPPSLPLTIGLTTLCFLATAFTARSYLIAFFRNIKTGYVFNMQTSITLGYVLSLIHTLYHVIAMPLVMSFSMTFMSFIMPAVLISIINVMDEMKRFIFNKSKKIHTEGIKSFFPQMADEYEYYDETKNEWIYISRSLLKKNMLIRVKHDSCFPVDGILRSDEASINVLVLTGKPYQKIMQEDKVRAGAINLGKDDVEISISEDIYNSSINVILASANTNRKKQAEPYVSESQFTYWYSGLIVTGVTASLVTPWAFGLFTVPLMLQNITGILFAICPCTIAIAHQLPKLWSMSSLQDKGIILRDEDMLSRLDDIDTIVFDKTGTLTTGQSSFYVSDISDENYDLWERIYLLEKKAGREHPIAHALCNHFEKNIKKVEPLFNDINNYELNNGGLSAKFKNKNLCLGNESYLNTHNVFIPSSDFVQHNLSLGYTPVYVAEDDVYIGAVFIRHEIREGCALSLKNLKAQNKKIILLTGDTRASADVFNDQIVRFCNGSAVFDEIHADQTPETKKAYLDKEANDKCMFVCDGFNDIWGAAVVSSKGGISCSITSNDQAALISDVSLNGSLDYILECKNINLFLQKNTLQNQGLLMYGSVSFLAFIIIFPIFGISMSPLIPVMIMVSTTALILFNSYRVKLSTDDLLDKNKSCQTQWLASDWSIGLLVAVSALLIAAILVATIAAGHLALPVFVFSSGVAFAISSSFILSALGLIVGFTVLSLIYLCSDQAESIESAPNFSSNIFSIHSQKKTFEEIQNQPQPQNSFNDALGYIFTSQP